MQKSKIDIFKKKFNLYKLDFGINEIPEPDKMSIIIVLAILSGFSVIDVLAKKEFVKIAIDAIKKAKQKSKELNIQLNLNPILCSSFNINLISNLDNKNLLNKIEVLEDEAIDMIEIHFNEIDFLNNMKKVDLICNLFKEKIISVNLSRKKLSNIQMVELLKKCFSISKKNLVIEVEGLRVYDEKFNHILQKVSTADIINKQFKKISPKYKKVPIILGDCKNREIEKLAAKCEVPFDGLSFFYKDIIHFLKNKYYYSDADIESFVSTNKFGLF